MRLTIMAQNLQYGGRANSQGRPDNRWPRLAEIIRAVRPDILLCQEAQRWGADPRLPAQAEAELGLRACVAPAPYEANTAVMFNPDILRCAQWETKYAPKVTHGFGVAVFDLIADPGVKAPLAVSSAHLTPYGAAAAEQEALLIAARVHRYGGMGVIGGDVNYYPPGDPEPDWESVPPYNRAARCLRRTSPDKPWRGNPQVGHALYDEDLVDVAALLAARQDGSREELLAPTGHRGGLRTDQFWITKNMIGAVDSYRRVPTGRASDHDAVVTVLETEALHHVRVRDWEQRPMDEVTFDAAAVTRPEECLEDR